MEENKKEMLKANVLNEIRNKASKRLPITSNKLCSDFQLTFRELKRIITELRNDYPIVSKETNGGGYWLAETEEDIIDFVNMINRRKMGYENTVYIMQQHLLNYGNVPLI